MEAPMAGEHCVRDEVVVCLLRVVVGMFRMYWAISSDLARPHPKWWFI